MVNGFSDLRAHSDGLFIGTLRRFLIVCVLVSLLSFRTVKIDQRAGELVAAFYGCLTSRVEDESRPKMCKDSVSKVIVSEIS